MRPRSCVGKLHMSIFKSRWNEISHLENIGMAPGRQGGSKQSKQQNQGANESYEHSVKCTLTFELVLQEGSETTSASALEKRSLTVSVSSGHEAFALKCTRKIASADLQTNPSRSVSEHLTVSESTARNVIAGSANLPGCNASVVISLDSDGKGNASSSKPVLLDIAPFIFNPAGSEHLSISAYYTQADIVEDVSQSLLLPSNVDGISLTLEIDRPLVPAALLYKLNPICVSVAGVFNLPDAPATMNDIDNHCAKPCVCVRISNRAVLIAGGEAGEWRHAPANENLCIRDVSFNHSYRHAYVCSDELSHDINALVASDEHVHVEVYDRLLNAARRPEDLDNAPVFASGTFPIDEIASSKGYLSADPQLLPKRRLRGRGQFDWWCRPGHYVEADAHVHLRLYLACPLQEMREMSHEADTSNEMRSEHTSSITNDKQTTDNRPFAVCIAMLNYRTRVFKQLANEMHSTNCEVLGLSDSSGERQLTTYKLTDEQISDPRLDIITGYHVTDGSARIVVLEGLRAGKMTRVQELLHEIVLQEGKSNVKVLSNLSQGFHRRMGASLGVELTTVKLNQPIRQLITSADVLLNQGVRTEIKQALKQLNTLTSVEVLDEAIMLDAIPDGRSVLLLERRFGVELRTEDVHGPKIKKSKNKRKLSRKGSLTSRRSNKSATQQSRRSTDSVGSLESARDSRETLYDEGNNDASVQGKPALRRLQSLAEEVQQHEVEVQEPAANDEEDSENQESDEGSSAADNLAQFEEWYTAEKAYREQIRRQRDLLYEETARLKVLAEQKRPIREQWQRWNPRKMPRDASVGKSAAESSGTSHHECASAANDEARHGFRLSLVEPHAPRFVKAKQLVSEGRREELHQPYDTIPAVQDVGVDRRSADAAAGNRPRFRLACAPRQCFSDYLSTTGFTVGDAADQERRKYERKRQEHLEWHKKVVVDTLHIQPGPPSKEKPTSALDKLRGFREGPLHNRSLVGYAMVQEPPVSHLVEQHTQLGDTNINLRSSTEPEPALPSFDTITRGARSAVHKPTRD